MKKILEHKKLSEEVIEELAAEEDLDIFTEKSIAILETTSKMHEQLNQIINIKRKTYGIFEEMDKH